MPEIEQKIREAIKDHEMRLHKRPRTMFKPPTVQEIDEYCIEKGITVEPKHIWDFYEKKGWMVGKNKMKNWRSAVNQAQTWESAPQRKLPASAESIEKQKERIRQEYGSYLRSKRPTALKDLRRDGTWRKCHFFIDEILKGLTNDQKD